MLTFALELICCCGVGGEAAGCLIGCHAERVKSCHRCVGSGRVRLTAVALDTIRRQIWAVLPLACVLRWTRLLCCCISCLASCVWPQTVLLPC